MVCLFSLMRGLSACETCWGSDTTDSKNLIKSQSDRQYIEEWDSNGIAKAYRGHRGVKPSHESAASAHCLSIEDHAGPKHVDTSLDVSGTHWSWRWRRLCHGEAKEDEVDGEDESYRVFHHVFWSHVLQMLSKLSLFISLSFLFCFLSSERSVE